VLLATPARALTIQVGWTLSEGTTNLVAAGDFSFEDTELDVDGRVDLVAIGANTDVIVSGPSGPDVTWSYEWSSLVFEFLGGPTPSGFFKTSSSPDAPQWGGPGAPSTTCTHGFSPCDWTLLYLGAAENPNQGSFLARDGYGNRDLTEATELLFDITVVPEPSILALVALAAVLLMVSRGGFARRS
jgi:hypothetical protein